MSGDDWLIGRYEVLRTISTGQRATVLQALDHVHDKPVAIKMYPLAGADRDAILAEARVLYDIEAHPALPVARGDFFTPDGLYFGLAMKWIEGSDLQQVLDDEGDPGLPFEEVRQALSPVADALDHLHTHTPPIVHGDIKPANLIRSANGKVVLVDFDIAAANATQRPLGTIGFVAPEVAAGDKPTPASDIYGLAATIVALLDGSPPGATLPNVAGVGPAGQAHLSRALRAALSTDPANRPRTARKLIDSLKPPEGDALPSGVLAFLTTEVVDAAQLWERDPEEMGAAMRRLRAVREEVVYREGGHIVAPMNEGEGMIAVFVNAPAAVSAASALHERVTREGFPPGIEVRLRAAVGVAQASPVDGVYSGPVIAQLVRLRSAAAPATTLCTEATAELLVDVVGRDLSIVPFEPGGESTLPTGMRVFELRAGGAPQLPSRRGRVVEWTRPLGRAPAADPVVSDDPAPPEISVSRRAMVGAALGDSTTLTWFTVFGVATIFQVVLSSALRIAWLGAVVMLVAAIGGGVSFSRSYSRRKSQQMAALAEARDAREAAQRTREVARQRVEARRRLEDGFSSLATDEALRAVEILRDLEDDFDSLQASLARVGERRLASLDQLLPGLSEEAYRRGMSALSDALEALERAEATRHARAERELAEIEARLAHDEYGDTDDRARDESRRERYQRNLAKYDQLRRNARELVFQAERCRDALAEAGDELVQARSSDAQVDVDAVVETLEQTIKRVRDVQEQFRRLGR